MNSHNSISTSAVILDAPIQTECLSIWALAMAATEMNNLLGLL